MCWLQQPALLLNCNLPDLGNMLLVGFASFEQAAG
jgi:hypothetical protein